MSIKNTPRSGAVKLRVHQFPPLRKVRQVALSAADQTLDPAEYQKQLMAGFQEGISQDLIKGWPKGKKKAIRKGCVLGMMTG